MEHSIRNQSRRKDEPSPTPRLRPIPRWNLAGILDLFPPLTDLGCSFAPPCYSNIDISCSYHFLLVFYGARSTSILLLEYYMDIPLAKPDYRFITYRSFSKPNSEQQIT